MLNHWTGMGRLTRDPEFRITGSGIAMASFALAIDRDYKDQDGNRKTDFVNVICWRSKADFARKYLKKGRLVCVTGRWEHRDWEEKNGNKRTSWSVNAENFYFADSKREAAPVSDLDEYAAAGREYYAQQAGEMTDITDEAAGELPF